MTKILGTKEKYYLQTNDGSIYLFSDYFKYGKNIACGPNSAVMAADIVGLDMSKLGGEEIQSSDYLLMVFHNPFNLPLWKQTRDIDYDRWPPNEVPQLYPAAFKLIYKKDVCTYRDDGLSFEIIKNHINNNYPLQCGGNFPAGGHYVTIVGYDDVTSEIIYNYLYPIQYADGGGYNRRLSWTEANKIFYGWYVLYHN